MVASLDDLVTWSYLAPAAAGLAVLALGAVLVLALRVAALGRQVRRLTGQAPATTRTAAHVADVPSPGGRRATSAPHGGVPGHPATGAVEGAVVPTAPGEGGSGKVPVEGGAPGTAVGDGPAGGAPSAAATSGPHGELPMPRWPSIDETRPVAPAPGAERDLPDGAGQQAPADHAVAVVAALREVSLLGRQLELLDELERREDDPDDLAALFALDNLTMRLRRHAESVLVLAGKETRRRAREPLSICDVVRTACSQVEDYERVIVTAQSDPVLPVARVVPLAHLLAEVLENATRFSAPETQVEVHVAQGGDDVVVTIVDEGIGMDHGTLADARARIRDASAGGGRIGLLVAGRLAQRLGVVIELDSGPAGTTVTVRVPVRLLAGAAAPGPAADAAGAGPAASRTPAPVTAAAGSDPAFSDPAFSGPASSGPAFSSPAFSPAPPEPGPTAEVRAPALDPAAPARPGAPAASWPPVGSDLSAPPALASPPALSAPPTPSAQPGRSVPPDFSAPPALSVPPGFSAPPTLSASAGALSAGPPVAVSLAAPPAAAPAFPTESSFVPQGGPSGTGGGELPRRGRPVAVPTQPTAPSGQQDGWFQPAPGSGGAGAGGPTLRDEAFAEIGRLSGYRPAQVAAGSAPPLERRTPQAVDEPVSTNRGPATRDAAAVKSRFAAFQSGRGRARPR